MIVILDVPEPKMEEMDIVDRGLDGSVVKVDTAAEKAGEIVHIQKKGVAAMEPKLLLLIDTPVYTKAMQGLHICQVNDHLRCSGLIIATKH